MSQLSARLRKKRRAAFPSVIALIFVLLCFAPHLVWSQSASGTISGTVTDPTGAVISNANVVLEDLATGVKSNTISNGTGFFSFAAVAPGTYKLMVKADGFAPFEESGIVEHQGENHNISHIVLPVGATSATVAITASDAGVIPLDNGSSTTTLNETMVDTLSVQGRNSSELVKFMPAMAMNSGLSQSEYSSQITQTNSGPIGSFSASGTQPYGSMQMTLDGAGMIDIGNMGTQIASVNGDQTAEFTYLNAAFGADTPRGPNIIQVVSKGGGQGYHGDLYTYLRNWQMNANDPYLKSQGITSRTIAHQTYPGGTVGGPVPSLFGYNRNHDKLFFFAGFEKMYQNPSANLHQSVIPTTDMINGNFSAATMPGTQSSNSGWFNTSQIPCDNAANWTSLCPNNSKTPHNPNPLFVNGQIPSSWWDPNGVALLTWLNKTHTPNIDPATHNGYNYQYLDNAPVNRWELRARGDWDPTQNDRVSFVYTKQNEADINNFGVWWEPSWTAPLPSPLNATTVANLWTANYVHTFNATTTNEFSFAKTYFTYPPKFGNPQLMDASAANYHTYSPFDGLQTDTFDQLPNLISWGAGTGGNNGSFAGVYAPAMVKDFNGAFGNIKKIMSLQDNLTKVVGRHSLKAGIFWDSNDQTQTTSYGNWTQGALDFDTWAQYTTNNPYADMLIGSIQSMNQVAGAPTHDVAFHEWAFYGQDKWQLSRRLTLDYGLRLTHEGQWYPVKGPGFAVFNPKLYDNTANASDWTGMVWHQTDKSIPQSGLVSKFLTPDVRVGAAYDLYGNGKSVIRGGFGVYRWQVSEGDVDGALSPAYNIKNITTPGIAPAYWLQQQGKTGGGYAALATFAPGTAAWGTCQSGSTCPSASVIKMGEDKTPYTMNWDVTLDQQLPEKMMFELQYMGNKTDDVSLTNNSTSNEASFSNINKIPMGALFGPNSAGDNIYQDNCKAGNCKVPDSSKYAGYRPYANYGVLNLIQRGSYSNYHGMVVALQKQTGPATFLVNYTWSKVMGIRDGNTENGGGDGPTINPFNMRDNYGPLAYDRTHLFNAAFTVNLPGLREGNRLVRQTTDGWQLSGDTQVQSGSPLQPNTGGTLNVDWTNANVSNASILGTNAPILVPYLSCDPRHGGGKYFNDKCFTIPNIQGQNGPSVWPNIKGPAFFVSDLALYKSFKVAEKQSLQFRVSAFNFLNHPLPQFGVGSDVKLAMNATTNGNTNTDTNGNVKYMAPGQNRFMEVALKYYF